MKKYMLTRCLSVICCASMLLSTNIYANEFNTGEVLNTEIYEQTFEAEQENLVQEGEINSNAESNKNIIDDSIEEEMSDIQETDINSFELTDEVLNHLTYEDMETIEEAIIEKRMLYPNLSDDELDKFSSELMVQLSEKNIYIKSSGSDFLSPSSEEKAYMKEHPREVATYSYCSNMANSEAKSRYTTNSLWYDGNGDAFRHVFWSASLVKRFHDVLGYNKSDSLDASKRWTDVHEPIADRGSLESKMDVQNNTTGRGIGARLYTDNSYAPMINEAQSYIDKGMAVRIGESSGKRKLVATDKTEKK